MAMWFMGVWEVKSYHYFKATIRAALTIRF